MSEHKYTNKLIDEKSPYLLQHAHNPVDWFPWSDEAFEKAVQEDKPIFLSIGYSTCHWCHVMERESFEDEEVAEILNKHFISIKVDREERPDVDHIYMTVCQALTGHGGWPLTIFMNPEKKPFFAGTYFPKGDRMGMSGLITLLNRVTAAWNNNRTSLNDSSIKIHQAISQESETLDGELPPELIHEAYSDFKYSFDSTYGGFGSAPKFPTPHNLYFLLRYWRMTGEEYALEMVEKTLNSMYRGGIYDHIGFGFSRYSTDKKWLVPHFEKMLYDNALLAIAYLETYQATKKQRYADIARQIFTYVQRDMTSPEGGFYSAEDADSEGEEGKFYVWTPQEIKQVLGDEVGERFCTLYHITVQGNFEGHSIPNLISAEPSPSEKGFLDECRKKLFDHREKRIHPYKDDKILTAWNGLMIAAMAIGGKVLREEKFTQTAEKAVEFIYTNLIRADGRLMARYRQGEAAFPAYVDDFAFLTWGLLELYETTYKPQYLVKALTLNDELLRLFWDDVNGGLYIYGSDSEQLISRPKEIYDGATPSGNSVATMNLLRLARLTGQHDLEDKALQQFKAFGNELDRAPRGHAFLLSAYLYTQAPTREVVLVGNKDYHEAFDLLQVVREDFRPFTLSMLYADNVKNLKDVAPHVDNYRTIDGKASAYVCENFACQSPVTDTTRLREMLQN